MQKNTVIIATLTVLVASLFINSQGFAGDIEWGGLYRIEAYKIENSELRSGTLDASKPGMGLKKEIGYGLSHLILRPKITAGDGITIYGQFDIFNSANYPNSQMGDSFGAGIGSPPTTSQGNSNSLSNTQQAETIEVTQLYMTLNHEYGQLIVGRAPLQFGLGMTYSAGRGLFDHWYDTRDLVGYKIVVGNMFFLPMLGKPSGGTINHSDNIDDYMIQAEYVNPETDLALGVFFLDRHSGDQGSDTPINQGPPSDPLVGGTGATNTTGMNTKIVNIYALKDTENFRIGLEASFMSGEAGVVTSSGDKVTWGGFGLAFETSYRPDGSNWKWGLKSGFASGDDPSSNAKFEGFAFNRNYDVAMLLFNHPLGQDDFLRSRLTTGSVRDSNGNINQADVETISNAMYFAPSARYGFSDKWSLDNTLVGGWLATNPIPGKNVSKDLGYEWDISLNFTPRKGVAWINQAGFLLPGSAWRADGTYDSSYAFGIGTKAAISF
jgi:hypothetical protein